VQPAPAPLKFEPVWTPGDLFKSLTWKGYVQTSYTYNFQRPKPATGNENVGRVFDTEANEFMLNAVELWVERPVNDDQYVGFVVNPLLGQTANFIHSTGFFDDPTDGEEVDLVQAYIQVYIPWSKGFGTTVKGGKFVTSAGAEVIYAPLNDQFSRSFLFGFAIPFTHTGLVATQPLLKRDGGAADMLTVSAGVANGWDVVNDNNESKVILTNAAFTPADEFALFSNFFYSFSEQAGNDSNGRTLFDFVTQIVPFKSMDESNPVRDLKFLGNLDIGLEEGASTTGGYATWWGFSLAVKYDFALTGEAKQWYLAGRGEYFDDDDGARTVAFAPDGTKLYEFTITLGYTPWQYLLLRSEVRFDHATEDVFFHGSGTGGNPDEHHQTTLAFDATFMF